MLLQGRTRRWFLLMGTLVAASACRDSLSPRELKPSQISRQISDGAHGGPNDDVFFLPPMVGNPSGAPGYGDPFQPNLPVTITVCQRDDTDEKCTSNVVANFPPNMVNMSLTDQMYYVNWDTKAVPLDTSKTYQIQVWVKSVELAYADVDVVATGSGLKRVDTGDFIGLVDGRTLPIKVRIEQGWNCKNNKGCVSQVVSASATTNTLVTTNDGRAAALFLPGTFSTDVIVTIEDVTPDLGAGETCKNPTGVSLTSMVVSPQCFKFTTDPKVTFQQPVTVATCVDVVPERETTDPLFHTEQLIKYDAGEQTVFLRNATPPITCPPETPSIGSTPSNSLTELAIATLSRAGRAVGRFFLPKSAYAFHLGVGGTIDDGGGFSYITAGFPISESLSSGDGQTGTVGTALAQQFKVLITSQHFNTVPVANEPVRCHITAGGGTFGNADTATVLTGSDGIAACPILTLGPTAGTNTVTATALNIDDGVVASEDFEGPTTVTLHGIVTFNATATAGTLGFVSVTTTDGQTPLDGSTFPIDGSAVNFIATIQNPGSAIGSSDVPVVLQNWIQQGKTRRAANGTDLTCTSLGVLPNGTCVQSWDAAANDVQASGTGFFSAGSATLILELWQGSVGDGTLLATRSIPITLTGVSQVPGAIQGTVRDASGAVIPGVTVTAVLGDGAPHSVQTNADGSYQITPLLAGTYSVTLSLGGFTAQQAIVTPGATTTVNFTPIPGGDE